MLCNTVCIMTIDIVAYSGCNIKVSMNFQKLVADISKITHSHQDAIIGAQLQCAAVHTALHQKVTNNT